MPTWRKVKMGDFHSRSLFSQEYSWAQEGNKLQRQSRGALDSCPFYGLSPRRREVLLYIILFGSVDGFGYPTAG
jgi:hypothetical protein